MKTATPVIKWAGGKKQLLGDILPFIPKKIATYYEPFIGGASVFFALSNRKRFDKAVISDFNRDLAVTYSVIGSPDVKKLIKELKKFKNDPEFFQEMREKVPSKDVDVAARFLYLNKTAFNGLYRVNKNGGFNVPFGRYENPTICDEVNLLAASEHLSKTTVKQGDFETIVESAVAGDFVYFDPPYLPKSDTSNFTAYTKEGFTISDHERLRDTALQLQKKGVGFLISNSDVEAIRKIFKAFEVHTVNAKRSINSDASKRGVITELLITGKV